MRSEKTHQSLIDIRDAIARARRFVQGLDRERFLADEKSFYAVSRCLEIISEASRRLPASFREKHAGLPWRQIIGLGKVYRHNCENVEENIVWSTVHGDLDPLLAIVTAELADFESDI